MTGSARSPRSPLNLQPGLPAPGSNAPAQTWKTEGLAPMERPGRVTRLFMAIVALCRTAEPQPRTAGESLRLQQRGIPLGSHHRT